MSANVLDLWENRKHLHTCFFWADFFICLVNTGSYATLKTRLSPGNWQGGFRRASQKKNSVSRFPWRQVLGWEVLLFLYIKQQCFCGSLLVNVPGTVNASDLLKPCQETRLSRETVLWKSDWRLLKQFCTFWADIFGSVFSLLLWAVSPQVLSWAWKVVVDNVGLDTHLSAHWSLECKCTGSGSLYYHQHIQPLGLGGVGICVSTWHCFSSLNFEPPTPFRKTAQWVQAA